MTIYFKVLIDREVWLKKSYHKILAACLYIIQRMSIDIGMIIPLIFPKDLTQMNHFPFGFRKSMTSSLSKFKLLWSSVPKVKHVPRGGLLFDSCRISDQRNVEYGFNNRPKARFRAELGPRWSASTQRERSVVRASTSACWMAVPSPSRMRSATRWKMWRGK